MPLKRGVEFGVVEPAVTTFVHHRRLSIRLQLRNDIGVPCIAYEDAALRSVWCAHLFTNSSSEVPETVRGIRGAKIREIWTKAHLEVNNLQLGSTSGGYNPAIRGIVC